MSQVYLAEVVMDWYKSITTSSSDNFDWLEKKFADTEMYLS